MSSTFSTPIDTVMEWDFLKTMEWYCEAYNLKMVDTFIQVKLSQQRMF